MPDDASRPGLTLLSPPSRAPFDLPPAGSGSMAAVDPDPPTASEPMPEEEFMAVVDKMVKGGDDAVPKYAHTAWGFAGLGLRRDVFPRKQCIALLEQWWFDPFILLLIGANCITMIFVNDPVLKNMIEAMPKGGGVGDYYETAAPYYTSASRNLANMQPPGMPNPICHIDGSGPCSFADYIDLVFLILFAIEMAIKMCAQGLILHKNAYLRQGWNWLDFIVVVIGFLDMYTSGLPAVTTLRLVKTLRPLRSLQRIRGMRVLVQTILEAMPQMCNVIVVLMLVIVVFALLGCALFKGALRHTCHECSEWTFNTTTMESVCTGEWGSTGAICNAECEWDEDTVTPILPCKSLGNTTRQLESYAPGLYTYSCRAMQECRCEFDASASPGCEYRSNPNYGITSFDSMPWAMISLFQAISLEGWVDMMYALMDGHSAWVFVYFVGVVLFGAIIVINLFLAVLCDNFEMNNNEGLDEVEKEEAGDEVLAKEAATLKHSNPLRQACLNLCKNKYFDWFIQGCIIFNTLVMTAKYAPQPTGERILTMSIDTIAKWDYLPESYFLILMVCNLILTSIFTFESIVKIIGLGPKLFVKDYMNVFDFIVVALSIFEIIMDFLQRFGSGTFTFPLPLSVLRAFRAFRLFKLAKSVKSINTIIVVLGQSLVSVFYLLLLLLLIILIFCLLGMELFGGYYTRPEFNYTAIYFPNHFETNQLTWDGGDPSRYHFDDFFSAFLSIFVVLSGENWNEIMFDSHRATWDSNTGKIPYIPFALCYFLALFFIGNLLLFNLFIAILLSNFGDDEEEPEKPEAKQFIEWNFNGYLPAGAEKKAEGEDGKGDDEEEAAAYFPTDKDDMGGDKSLMIFGWDSPIRVMCAKLTTHWLFETIIVSLIVFSTILLVIDMPHLPLEHPMKVFIRMSNYAFAVIFLIEMLMKFIVHGLWRSRTPTKYVLSSPYFADPWNWLDAFIVVVSFVIFLFPTIKFLRAFRALRVLRLVNRYESLKITVMTLFASIPAMGALFLVSLLFFFIFGILGLELYGGKLGYCLDPDYAEEPFGSRVIPGISATGQNDYEECMSLSRYNISRRTTDGILFTDMADMFPDANPSWLEFSEFPQWSYPQWGNFDHIATSLMALFEISALEGWPDVMHSCMDTDADHYFVYPWRLSWYDSNPAQMYGAWNDDGSGVPMEMHQTQFVITGLFFVAWIFFGCFVVVNMTVGVVCDTFADIKDQNAGVLLMSDDSAEWVKTQKQVFATRPLVQSAPPVSAWRLNVYYMVNSTRFELLIMCIILANMLQMAFDFWEPASNNPNIASIKSVMKNLNLVFLITYIIEMLIKWIGKSLPVYFCNHWDQFDFILVCVSTFEVIMSNMGGSQGMPFPPTIIRVLRLFRVVRILRVIKTAKQLRTIFMTVWISMPQLTNIGLLMTLVIIIFQVIFSNLFAFVNYTPGYYDMWHDLRDVQSKANRTFTNPVTGLPDMAPGEALPWELPDYDSLYFFSDDRTNWGDALNRHANFAYFWTGILLLIRASTGEYFNGIMHDCHSYSWGWNRLTCCPECGPIVDGNSDAAGVLLTAEGKYVQLGLTIPSTGQVVNRVVPENSCGSTTSAWILFFLFQILMAYIVLSIMIGVILENFSNVGGNDKRINMDDLEEFREVWLKYDPHGTKMVPSHNLLAMLQQLRQPLGIANKQPALTRVEMLKHLAQVDIPDHDGYVRFVEVLTALSYEEYGRVQLEDCETTRKLQKMATKKMKFSTDHPVHDVHTTYLVSLLQSRWRGFAMRRRAESEEGGDQKVKSNQVAPAPPGSD